MKTTLICLIFGALVLTGCGATQVGEPTSTVMPASTATSAPTIEAGATATPTCTVVVPGMPNGLCGEQTMTPVSSTVVVVGFSVWQDFMPSVPRDGAPLHASLALSIDWPEKITPNITHGTLKLLRASGDELLTADLQLNQWVDDLGLVQPGPQQVTFSIAPVPVAIQLVEGELLRGVATITLSGKTLNVDLPETQLLFTH